MNSRALTLQQQTRIAVNILIEDNTGTLIYTVLVVTQLIAVIGSISRWLFTVGHKLSMVKRDIKVSLQFTGTVFFIGLKALAFGLDISI